MVSVPSNAGSYNLLSLLVDTHAMQTTAESTLEDEDWIISGQQAEADDHGFGAFAPSKETRKLWPGAGDSNYLYLPIYKAQNSHIVICQNQSTNQHLSKIRRLSPRNRHHPKYTALTDCPSHFCQGFRSRF